MFPYVVTICAEKSKAITFVLLAFEHLLQSDEKVKTTAENAPLSPRGQCCTWRKHSWSQFIQASKNLGNDMPSFAFISFNMILKFLWQSKHFIFLFCLWNCIFPILTLMDCIPVFKIWLHHSLAGWPWQITSPLLGSVTSSIKGDDNATFIQVC